MKGVLSTSQKRISASGDSIKPPPNGKPNGQGNLHSKAGNIHTTAVEDVKKQGETGKWSDLKRKRTVLDIALKHAKLGIHVVWGPRGHKNPMVRGWPDLATTDPKLIRQWAAEHPGCNFYLVMGHGFVCIDVDNREVLSELEERGLMIPDTLAHGSPRGGHFIFKTPPGVEIHSSAGKINRHVDVKGYRSHIPCPGSIREDGSTYVPMRDADVAMLPEPWLEAMIAIGSVDRDGKRIPPTARAKSRRKAAPRDVPEGQRNDALFRLGAGMRRGGLEQDEIEAALLERNSKFSSPLSEQEVQRIADSDTRYEPDAGCRTC